MTCVVVAFIIGAGLSIALAFKSPDAPKSLWAKLVFAAFMMAGLWWYFIMPMQVDMEQQEAYERDKARYEQAQGRNPTAEKR
jgi:hypothetical protein